MKTLKSLTKLPHSYTLFIPSTSEVNKDGSSLQQSVFTSLAKELSSRYGGTTRSAPSDGLWMSESEGLVSDNVWPLTTFVPDNSESTQDYFINLAEGIKGTMSQEVVFMVVDGEGYLV